MPGLTRRALVQRSTQRADRRDVDTDRRIRWGILTVAVGLVFVQARGPALAVPATQGAHDPSALARQPFAATSVWNLPLSPAAEFEDASAPQTASVLGGDPVTAVHQDANSHPVVRAGHGDPVVTVTDDNDGRRSASYRIPGDAQPAMGSGHLHVISPDGRTVDEAWRAQRTSPTSYRVGRHERVDLAGSGIGPANGTRAYGGSAIAGLIRAWEVDPTHPSYTGRIRHPIAMALRSDQLLYAGGAAGYDAQGYGTSRGYTWPATEQDWDAASTYSGQVPMGAYVAIPPGVDIHRLGLSRQGLMLADAYQNYGGYVTDRAASTVLAYVEPSAPRAFAAGLLGADGRGADLRTIRAQLRIVTSNSSARPNGGPLGAPRRSAPDSVPASSAPAAPAPAVRAPTEPAPAQRGPVPGDRVPVASARGNPFIGARGYVDPGSRARREADARRSWDPAGARALDRIAASPVATWYGDWLSVDAVARTVSTRVSAETAAGALPVLVAYAIPGRDCGGHSAGGARDATAYREWISQFAKGIGDRRAVVVLEPDALALMQCLSPSAQTERTELLRSAVGILSTQPHVTVYLDAGGPGWHPPEVMAPRLQAAGVDRARGFAVNVSGFETTAASTSYGEALSSKLSGKPIGGGPIGDKHFVVDTARNGAGPGGTWCNPPGRALGATMTTDTGSRHADALLWIKSPGESDGTCNGGPPAGQWWPDYAIGLAQRAP